MPLNLASPGLIVREVDLTAGRVDAATDKTAAIVAPFAKGPVDLPTVIATEQDLLDNFGQPYAVDKHYEHWMVASSYLAYGGQLNVVRSDDADLRNAVSGVNTSIKIKSNEHYVQLGYDENTNSQFFLAAKNPGSWANNLRVAIVDGFADQVVSVASTSGLAVGYGVTQAISATLPGAGTTSVLDGYLKGVITSIGSGSVSVKLVSHVSAAGTQTDVDYQESGVYRFTSGSIVTFNTSAGVSAGTTTPSASTLSDWFGSQSISLSNGTVIAWNGLANRPQTSEYSAARGGRFDEVHVVVIDDKGEITGNAGTILEKHLSLSKAKDAEYSSGSPSYWRKYLEVNSEYLFAGSQPHAAIGGITTATFSAVAIGNTFTLESDTAWDQDASGVKFGCHGNSTVTLANGLNYNGQSGLTTTGALTAGLSNLVNGYTLFENTENYSVDFILMGSAAYDKENAQALANKCIAVAEERKDAIAFISPYRGAALTDTTSQTETTVNSDATITDNVISFYSALTSSSFGVFDSGYKYMFDRFNNTFRYVPLNGDLAGMCARNDINNFPWFSPAGTARGAVLNAVKLAYNPSKSQRDKLYTNRINPVVFLPGSGIVLFGDKTGLARSSAFDRINVRRLFIYLEQAISQAAKDQLFEFNDEITRTNFVNIIEPFLRDVQAKRGIFDYVVVCDETNNTAAVIDNNEFVADIYIKPARSINFIGLTFVATRTGVAFEEVVGNV
jgi:hypothetical protein